MVPYSDNNKLTIINLLAGPSAGKSLTAMGVTYYMKSTGKSVEYVPEVAKDYTFEGRHQMLTEQDYIFSKQNNRFRRLVGQVDYVVTDTSLLLGFMYMPTGFPAAFKEYLYETYHSYNNINILIKRDPNMIYDPIGRNQTIDEAIQIDNDLRNLLVAANVPFIELTNEVGKNLDLVQHITNNLVFNA